MSIQLTIKRNRWKIRIRCNFREILENHQFSPLSDLMKHGETGLLRLADENKCKLYARIESMEADIVEYFKSRNEDSTTRTTVSPSRQETKYVAPPQKQSYRSGFQSSRSQFSRDNQNYFPSTTDNAYVSDDYPHSHLCTCDGRHHTDNHHCFCTSHQIDDKQCWDSIEHRQEICLPTNDENRHHQHFSNDDSNSGYTYDGREDSSQHYDGPGSFY